MNKFLSQNSNTKLNYFFSNFNPIQFYRFPLLSRNGPNGGPSFITSLLDIFALDQEILNDLSQIGGPRLSLILKCYFELKKAGILNQEEITKFLLDKKVSLSKGNKKILIRRLCKFADKEGKQRVIALSDYYTQSALQPLHDFTFEILQSLKSDYTFDQLGFMKIVPIVSDNHFVNWYSIDLTAATDRFPRDFIQYILKTYIGPIGSQS